MDSNVLLLLSMETNHNFWIIICFHTQPVSEFFPIRGTVYKASVKAICYFIPDLQKYVPFFI